MLKQIKTIFWLIACSSVLAGSAAYSKDNTQTKPINIDITTHLGDVQSFQQGDTISFLLSLDTDAHVLVIYENADGQLVQLLPNKVSQKSIWKAGLFITLPDSDAGFIFKIQPPFGKEKLWAFAMDVSLPDLQGQYLTDGLKQLTINMPGIRKILRGHKKQAYGESRLIIHTSKRE